MCYDGRKFRKGAGRWSINRSYGKKIIETEKKADAPQTDDAESITDFLCVVIGLLFLALIWKFAGAQLAKKELY